MGILTVDLGTTNIKAMLYGDDLKQLSRASHKVVYQKEEDRVEFSPSEYFDTIINLFHLCCAQAKDEEPVHQIVLTGQAESLVVLRRDGTVRSGISWLDMRSVRECAELSSVFEKDQYYRITGQPEIIPTWPITKILWLKRNEPELFESASKYLLLKDYIIYRLTGIISGEFSISSFSCYFDIVNKKYWGEILDYCGVQNAQMPELLEPCGIVGPLLSELYRTLEIKGNVQVNTGTVDHFSGMIGTGNIHPGLISESSGTVLSIATLLEEPYFSETKIPIYAGPFPNTYVLLPVCESGGISMEWFRDNFINTVSYRDIDATSALCGDDPTDLVFLPYLTGTNAPDFNKDASGVFFGLRTGHDPYDCALAIMRGVACLLRKNIEHFAASGIHADRIISTGGGAKSKFWSQLKANFTGRKVAIPENEEAPCLGAAIIGAVSSGLYPSFEDAISASVKMKEEYSPSRDRKRYNDDYALFEQIYQDLQPSFAMHTQLRSSSRDEGR